VIFNVILTLWLHSFRPQLIGWGLPWDF